MVDKHIAYIYRSGEIHIGTELEPGTRWLLLEGDPLKLAAFLRATTDGVNNDGRPVINAVRHAESDDDAETAMLVWMWGTGHAAYKAGLRPTYNSENIKRFEQTVVRAAP